MAKMRLFSHTHVHTCFVHHRFVPATIVPVTGPSSSPRSTTTPAAGEACPTAPSMISDLDACDYIPHLRFCMKCTSNRSVCIFDRIRAAVGAFVDKRSPTPFAFCEHAHVSTTGPETVRNQRNNHACRRAAGNKRTKNVPSNVSA